MPVALETPTQTAPECNFCGGRKSVVAMRKLVGPVLEKCPQCDGLGVLRLPIVTGGPSGLVS